MNELNAKHLTFARELLTKYKSGEIKFCHLVSRPDELITNLQNPPYEWLKEVQSIWFNLEEINAMLLDESNKIQTETMYKDNGSIGISGQRVVHSIRCVCGE